MLFHTHTHTHLLVCQASLKPAFFFSMRGRGETRILLFSSVNTEDQLIGFKKIRECYFPTGRAALRPFGNDFLTLAASVTVGID